ncbi:MAG: adenine deaminase [Solobacterium sp.]|nr:adenine deaminase [Solobacterium sp.]
MKTKEEKLNLIKAAMGELPCDKTVTNIQFVNVFTGEIYPAEVDIFHGYVIRVRTAQDAPGKPASEIIDGEGRYLIPGYVDTHMHIESTMLIPENFARVALPWGTTTINHDPHEIGNVLGVPGIRFMIENGKKTPQRQYAMASSCVPAVVGIEHAGASFTAEEISEILEMENVTGVAEIMDFVGVITGSARMHDIIEAGISKGAFLQGHCPKLSGAGLDAYVLSGIESDHETSAADEVVERLRRGMFTDLKSSSLVDNFSELSKAFPRVKYHDHISFCTDDVHVGDLLTVGHMNNLVRQAIRYGADPVDAIRMATLNGAREERLTDVGAIAPGYHADFQLVNALDGEMPVMVFVDGELIAENGNYLGSAYEPGESFENTVHTQWITSAEDLLLTSDRRDNVTVNVMVPEDSGNIIRHIEPIPLPVKDGIVSLEGREDLAYVCVINRHGLQYKTIGVMKNFGLKEGAIGCTISHDSHNLILVYKNHEDAFVVLKKLEEAGGGMALAVQGELRSILPLPVAGLMSDKPADEVNAELVHFRNTYYEVMKQDANLQAISLMSLTALPGVIITDMGLADGITQKLIPVFAD